MTSIKTYLNSLGRGVRTGILALAVIFVSAGLAQAATTISTNVSTDGTLGVTGAATLSSTLAVTGLSSLAFASSTLFSANSAYFGASATSTFSSAGALTLVGALSGTSGSFSTTLGVTGASTLTGLTSMIQASSTRLSVFNTAYFGGSATSTFSSAGALALVSALNKGTVTMSGGTNTVTVASGAICTVADNTNATSTKAVVVGTTLTISVGSPTSGGNTDVVSYLCL